MWRWKERAAPRNNQQTPGAFILYLISLKTARRYGAPNELMLAHAKMGLSDSLIHAIKEACRLFLKSLA